MLLFQTLDLSRFRASAGPKFLYSEEMGGFDVSFRSGRGGLATGVLRNAEARNTGEADCMRGEPAQGCLSTLKAASNLTLKRGGELKNIDYEKRRSVEGRK